MSIIKRIAYEVCTTVLDFLVAIGVFSLILIILAYVLGYLI